jgi:glycosyltransferase 2 family protein
LGGSSLARKLAIGVVLGLAVVLAMGLFADLPRLLDSLSRWNWAFVPVVLLAVLANYGLRFLRWHLYLAVIGANGVSVSDSLSIFLSGFTLTMTPGKLGEVLKSFLLKQLIDTPVSYSASLVIAERLTDVLGMALLAAAGLGIFQIGAPALITTVAAGLALILVVQRRDLSLRLIGLFGRLPVIGRFAGLATNLYESSHLLLRPRPLLAGIALATLAWFAECLAFFVVILGLGIPASSVLLLQATFIYAIASLLGAVSFLPGGLGATEGTMAILLTQLCGLGKDPAIAATLLVRFATLWFAVLLGVAALLLFQRRLASR